ncbi:MAG: aminotransferase class I/II-fold pyridoxal phosphate-dependent enzyme [archaeon]
MRALLTKRVSSLTSAIRDILKPARALEASGKKMYYFNIGDPNKFDFDTPDHLKEALKREIDRKVGHYSDSEGKLALREKIAEVEGKKAGFPADAESIVITAGLSEALLFLAASLLEDGDEILLPAPVYPPYSDYSKLFGGKVVTYPCVEGNGWAPDVSEIEGKISERTKAICVISPNNPTGAVYPPETIKKIIKLGHEKGIPVIVDEIYDKLIFGGAKHVPAAKLAGDLPVIVMNGFSKNFLAPGWRLGYIYFHNPAGDPALAEVEEGVKKLSRLRLSASTPLQRALVSAWDDTLHFGEIQRKLSERAELVSEIVNSTPGLSVQKPLGAFYVFPKVDLSAGGWASDKEFVLDQMRETGLVVVNGSGFLSPGHFRSVILAEPETLREAFGKLRDFMEKKIKS